MSETRISLRALTALSLITSAFALMYTQLLVKALVSVAGDVIFVQTLTLACYLGAFGLGSFIGDAVQERRMRLRLTQVEFGLSLAGALGVLFVYAVYFIYKFYFHDLLIDSFVAVAQSRFRVAVLAQILTVALGLFSGLELAFWLRLARGIDPSKGTSYILGGNYLGAVMGITAYAALVPLVSPLIAGVLTALANLGVFAYLAWNLESPERWRRRLHLGMGYSLAAMLIYISVSSISIEQWHLKAKYTMGLKLFDLATLPAFMKNVLLPRADVIHIQTRYQAADFVPSRNGDYVFYLDGHRQIDQSWSASYHESLIHMPVQFYKNVPKRVLVLGGGDGVATQELLKYGDAIESIDVVELDPDIIKLARENRYFLNLNKGAFLNNRVRVHAQDAIQFLRLHSQTYDAIIADFPLPYDYDLLKLFSVEMYRMIAARLSPDGIFVFDSGMGTIGESKKWNKIVWNTLKAAGFKGIYPYIGNEIFVVARLDERQPQFEFTDFGLNHQFLNHETLLAANHPAESYEIDPEQVNSIFKPKLRALRAWQF